MKVLLFASGIVGFLCFGIGIDAVASKPDDDIEKGQQFLKEYLTEKFQTKVLNERIDLPGLIPSLPAFFEPPNLSLSLDNVLLKGNISSLENKIYGLDSVKDNLNLNLITLDFIYSVNIAGANITGDYNTNVEIPLFNNVAFTGNGLYSVAINNASLAVGAKLLYNVQSQKFQITNLDLKILFDSLNINAENAILGELPLNWTLINEGIKPLFDFVLDGIYGDLIINVQDLVNEVLNGYTLRQIVDIILSCLGGNCDIPVPSLRPPTQATSTTPWVTRTTQRSSDSTKITGIAFIVYMLSLFWIVKIKLNCSSIITNVNCPICK